MRNITLLIALLFCVAMSFATTDDASSAAFDNPNFVLDANGVTCKCDAAAVGDTGTLIIGGVSKTFTKRTEAQLRALINANQSDPEIALTCTSGITDMNGLFHSKGTFNQDIGSWDVSSVTNMREMFVNAFNFNQNISNWDVSNVDNMVYMFLSAFNFNIDIGNWDVSKLENAFGMFNQDIVFNKDIGSWDVSSVTNMGYMFFSASSFNQDLSNWCVTNFASEPSNFDDNSALQASNLPVWGTCPPPLPSCTPPAANSVSASATQVGTDVEFTISAPAGVTVSYSGDASGTATNGQTVTVSQSVLTSGTATITIDSAYLTSNNSCSTAVGASYNGTFCNSPSAGAISASGAQVGTDVVFTISVPSGVTVAYSGDASGTATNGQTVTISQSVLTSGSSSITLDSAYLTSDNSCSTPIGATYNQSYCNAPSSGAISATAAQVGQNVVFTISAPVGVTVSYSGDATGTATNGQTVTISQSALTSGTASITIDSAYLTSDNSCSTAIGTTYNGAFCNPPSSGAISASSAQVGQNVVFTISAPAGVTVTYSGDASGTVVNGGTVTVPQLSWTSGTASITLDSASLTSDNSCSTALGGVGNIYSQAYCNPPMVNDVDAVGSVSGDDIIFTVVAPANVIVEITSVQGSITAVNGDVITFVDGNLIHSVDFSVTITGAYLISDNSCATDFIPDNEIVFTVPRSRHPFATDDYHTLAQTKSRSIRPLKRGTDDSDPNGLPLRVKTINGVAVVGGVQSIPVPNGVLTIDDEDKMWFKSDNSFTGLTQFPYEVINTDRYEDDGVVFVDVLPLPKQPTDPTAVDDFYSMQQGTTLEVKPLTKGVDDNDPNDLDLFITAIDGTPITGVGQVIPVTNGLVEVLNAEATEFAFTPDSSFSGTTTFDYTITSLIEDTDTATVTVIVDPLPQGLAAPVATDDAYFMDQGTTIDLRPLTKSTDDSDPNDLELTIISINSVALTGGAQSIAVPNGQVDIDANDKITFTPNVAFTNGVIMFPYTITNTINLTDSALQNITVNAVTVSNGAPTATDDNYTTDQGEERRIRPLTKGVNDSDPNNNDLFIYSIAGEEIDYDNLPQTIDVVIATTTVGSVTFEDENDITFTPASSTTGTVSFPYVIVNETITPTTMPSATNSASANQIIEVIPVAGGNGNPVAIDDTYSLKQGSSREIKPLTRHYDDYDPNGLSLVITHLGGEEVDGGAQDILIPNATIAINADDEIFFVPDPNFFGTITFSYVIKNTNNDTDTGMVTMIVDADNNIPNAPMAIDDEYTIPLNTTQKIAPLTYGVSDSDPNGEQLSIAYINGEEVYGDNQIIDVPNGKLQVNSADDITFIPNKDYIGISMFSYEIVNAIGINDTGLQTVNVIESSALNTNNFVLSEKDFAVYPNPSNGDVFVRLTSNLATNAKITLFDITGKTIHSSRENLEQGQNTLKFNFNVSAGVLFLKVTNNSQTLVKKLVIE